MGDNNNRYIYSNKKHFSYTRNDDNFIEKYSCRKINKKITCDSCNHYIPVNEITKSVECSLCGSENKLGEIFWKDIKESANYEKLSCEQCKTEFQLQEMIDALENNTPLVCKNCGTSIKSRKLPPKHISYSNLHIVGVFNEISTKIDSTNEKAAIEVECSNCGAPLEIDGKSKFAKCSFCGTNNLISQITLQHLNPLKINPFFILTLDKRWDTEVEKRKREEEITRVRNEVARDRARREKVEKDRADIIRYNRQKESLSKKMEAKKERNWGTIKTAIGFISLIGLLTFLIIASNTDWFGYAHEEEIPNTNYSFVKVDNKWGVINNKTGDLCIPINYSKSQLDYFFNDYFIFSKKKDIMV